jgi:hypothetical protein
MVAVKSRILFVFNDLLWLCERKETDTFCASELRCQTLKFWKRFRCGFFFFFNEKDQVHDNPPKNVGGKQAFIVTLKAKQNLEIVLAFKEEEEKTQLISDIFKVQSSYCVWNPFVCSAVGTSDAGREGKERGKHENAASLFGHGQVARVREIGVSSHFGWFSLTLSLFCLQKHVGRECWEVFRAFESKENADFDSNWIEKECEISCERV